MMRRIGVVIGCLAFALAACGDGDDNTSAEDAIEEALEDVEEGDIPGAPGAEEACKVVKQDDVEAVFGGDVGEATEDFAGCNFEVTGGAVGVDGNVSVRIEITGGLDPSELFEASQEGYDPGTVEDVGGVGDGAYYVESVGAITVLAGDTVFTVQGVFLAIGTDTTVDQGDLQTRIIDLAEIVAGRV
ncbi:MAG TPA: hypothetical protein VMQ81_02875 [Acidimicrobiia bacterium]|nr:hypothetical protein [Acidimicrobiia bacterium]